MGGYAQVPGNHQFANFIEPQRPLIALAQGWQHEGRTLDVPFQLSVDDVQSLEFQFTLPPNPPDTLLLYIRGLMGTTEVELNDVYLGVTLSGPTNRILPVPLTWFTSRNILRLRMHPDAARPYAPQAQVGLVEAPLWLDACDTTGLTQVLLPISEKVDSVAILAASYPDGKFGFNAFYAARVLLPLKKHGIQHVYFPYEPGRKFRAFCARMGLIEVKHLGTATQVAWINAYPYARKMMPGTPRFWLDERGRTTAHFGQWQSWGDGPLGALIDRKDWLVALLIIAPFLGLFLVKWLLPGFWAAQQAMLRKPQLFLENSSEGGYSQSGALFFLVLARWLSVWSFGSLILYGVVRTMGLSWLNSWAHDSLLFEYLGWVDSLGWIMLTFGVVLLGWLMLKAAFLLTLSAIFRIKNLWSGSLIVDIIGSYPLVFLLPFAAAFLLFTDPEQAPWILGGLVLLWSVYFARRMYVIYTGLGRLFSFSYGMKFLYICTLNLIPYIIWL